MGAGKNIFFTQVNFEADKPCRNVQIWMRSIDLFIEGPSSRDAQITHLRPTLGAPSNKSIVITFILEGA